MKTQKMKASPRIPILLTLPSAILAWTEPEV